MSTRKIIANTLYYGVVPKLTVLATFFTLPLITPYLTPYDYGVYGVINSYSSVIAMLAPLGLYVHLTNSYFEYPKSYHLIWGRVLCLYLISGLLFGIVNCLILFFILPFSPSINLFFLCLMGSVNIFFFGNQVLAQNLFPLESKPKSLVFTNLFASCMGILVSFILIYYFRTGYWGLVMTGVTTTLIAFVLFIKFVWVDYNIRPIIEKNIKRLKMMFKISLPLVPHSLGFVLLSSSASIIMTLYKVPYEDIGLYNHGCGIGQYVVIVTTALVTALAPQVQKAYRNNDYPKYRKLYFFTQVTAITSTFLFCIWMPDLYNLLIKNQELKMSSSIAMTMCFLNVVFPLYSYMSCPAFIEKDTVQVLWLVFIPGLINVILCLIFIPIYGYKAAIYAPMVSYWSQILVPFFIPYFKKSVDQWLKHKYYLLILLCIILFCLTLGNLLAYCLLPYKLLFSVIIILMFIFFYYHKEYNLSI